MQGEKAYSCPLCGTRFTYRNGLIKHTKLNRCPKKIFTQDGEKMVKKKTKSGEHFGKQRGDSGGLVSRAEVGADTRPGAGGEQNIRISFFSPNTGQKSPPWTRRSWTCCRRGRRGRVPPAWSWPRGPRPWPPSPPSTGTTTTSCCAAPASTHTPAPQVTRNQA